MKTSNIFDNIQYSGKTTLEGSLRVNFVRKVFSIVGVQLLLTAAMSFLSMTSQSYADFQVAHTSLLLVAGISVIALMIALMCFSSMFRSFPTNYILLGLCTLSESYLVSFIVQAYDEKVVVMALFATASVVSTLTIYAMTTKNQLEYFHGFIAMGVGAMFSLCLMSFFLGGNGTQYLISIIAALLSGLYLIYDIKLIMGNDRKQIGVDDYILASIMIYMDVIRIFIEILKILDKLQGKDKKKK